MTWTWFHKSGNMRNLSNFCVLVKQIPNMYSYRIRYYTKWQLFQSIKNGVKCLELFIWTYQHQLSVLFCNARSQRIKETNSCMMMLLVLCSWKESGKFHDEAIIRSRKRSVTFSTWTEFLESSDVLWEQSQVSVLTVMAMFAHAIGFISFMKWRSALNSLYKQPCLQVFGATLSSSGI